MLRDSRPLPPPADRHRHALQHGRRPGAARATGRAGRTSTTRCCWSTKRTPRACSASTAAGVVEHLADQLTLSTCPHPHRHAQQGARHGRRIRLRPAVAHRLAGQPGPAVRLFDGPTRRHQRRRNRGPRHRRAANPTAAANCSSAPPISARGSASKAGTPAAAREPDHPARTSAIRTARCDSPRNSAKPATSSPASARRPSPQANRCCGSASATTTRRR